jgi:ABC-type glycerol-3-phosphate transport system permease component
MTMPDALTAPVTGSVRAANDFPWRRVLAKAGIGIATAAVVLFAVFPIYWMIVTAISDLGSSRSTQQALWPTSFTLDNFIYVFTEVPFGLWLFNSAVVASLVAAGATIVGAMAGYSLARFNFRWTGVFVLVILATQLMPPTAIIIPIYRLALATGLLNTYTGLVIANLTHVLPIAIFLLRGFFLSIPSEIEQAALVDGCGQVGMLTRITMRMAAPGLATVFIYAFVVTWNDLLFARTLSSSGSMWTAPVGLASFQGEYYTLFEPLMAASLVFALPVTVVFLLLQRHFVHGLTVGGVKG